MKSVCFTGHRVLSGDINNLGIRLYDILEREILNAGITQYYGGGAVEWDTLCAQTVLKLREKYPSVKLNMILPCSPEEQSKQWTDTQRTEYFRILRSADSIEQLAQHYYNGCMKIRNMRLVELSDCCFCYFDSNRQYSGTAQTLRMALRKNIIVVNFYRK